jgi:rRNA maturation endonuclease Nob1
MDALIESLPAIELSTMRMRAGHGPYVCQGCRTRYQVVVQLENGEEARVAPPRFCPVCGAESHLWRTVAAKERLAAASGEVGA